MPVVGAALKYGANETSRLKPTASGAAVRGLQAVHLLSHGDGFLEQARASAFGDNASGLRMRSST